MVRTRTAIRYTGLILLTLIMFTPLYSVFVMGTYVSEDIFRGNLPLMFSDHFLENLGVVIQHNFFEAFFNSMFVSLFSVLFSVLTSALMGFALAKYEFKLKNFLFVFIIVAMMIPNQVTIIGYMRTMRTFGLLNTLWPLVFVWIAHPLGVFFMTQFIKGSVPTEVMESARIDGCSEPGIFARIVLPLIRPAILTVSLLVFLWSWNSFMIPRVLINRQELFTIPLMVSTLSTVFRTDYGAIMNALSIAIFPIIILFALCSKNFVQGIATGAVKG